MNPAQTQSTGREGPGYTAAVLLLFVLPLALYARAVSFGFVNYDDVDFLVNNPAVHGLSPENLARLFTHYIRNIYYPVTFLSFATDYSVWGGASAAGYHATNLALHLANIWLVALLARRLAARAGVAPGDAGRLALFAGALFALHPAAVQPVGWLLGRKELLTVFFSLSALLLHERAVRPSGQAGAVFHVLSGYAALLCALSHVTAMTLPVAAVLFHLVVARERRAGLILLATSYLWAFAGLAVFLRLVALLSWNQDSFNILYPHLPTALAHLPEMLKAWLAGPGAGAGGDGAPGLSCWGLVLKALLLPGDLVFPVFLRGIEVTGAGFAAHPLRLILGTGALAGLGAVLARFRHDRLFLFGTLWCLAALVPALGLHGSLIPPSRFYYLPMAGLSLAAGALVVRGARARPRLAWGVFFAVLAIYAGLEAARLGDYQDGLRFHTANARAFPGFWKARQTLGLEYVRLGRPGEAAGELLAAARLAPDRDRPWTDLVVLAMGEKWWDRAVAWAREAVEARPGDSRRRAILATALDRAGQGDEAMEEFSRALALDPRDPALLHAWGAALYRRGDLSGAIRAM
ncbi:MAG: hypothetical protein ABIJ95_00210, partial [Pseudomonadota bacterium]